MEKTQEGMEEQNNFLHMQDVMARSLKAWVYWQHQHIVRKNKKRLFEIFNPKVVKTRRGV